MTSAMHVQPSRRLIDQRCRNRIFEAIEVLANGEHSVVCIGPAEYFEQFYDWIPHRDQGKMSPNSAMTEEERTLIAEVSRVLDDACDATSAFRDPIALARLARIQHVATAALELLRQRGRFSEEHEEDVPSRP